MIKRMSKTRIIIRLSLLVLSVVSAAIYGSCRHAKAEGGVSHPEDGWTPPSWIDTIGQQTEAPTPDPSEAPGAAPGMLMTPNQQSKVSFTQFNIQYLYQSASNRYVVYAHSNSSGSNNYYNYPPWLMTPGTNLAGTVYTQGRILPSSGHTSATQSIQLDNESYLLVFRDEPRMGDFQIGDTVHYSFKSESSLQLYTSPYQQSTVDRWVNLGYSYPAILVQFSTEIYVNDLDGNLKRTYTHTDSCTWTEFSVGWTYDIPIPQFDSDNERVAYMMTFVCINPLSSGSALSQPIVDSFLADNLTPVIPHYIFSDGGIWWSRNVTESTIQQTGSVIQGVIKKLFVPDPNNIERIFEDYIDIENSEIGEFALTLRDVILDFVESYADSEVTLEITLPEFSFPINGTEYMLWEEYHFDLANMLVVNGGVEGIELWYNLVSALRFAIDVLIVSAFYNSIFAIVTTMFDLHLWKGTEGEDIT